MTPETPVKRGRGRPKKDPALKKKAPARRTGRKPAAVDGRTTAAKKKEALAAYYEYGTICRACKVAKISRDTWRQWRMNDEQFKSDAENAALDVADDLEEVAIKRAKDDSDTMLIFLLKGFKPDKYAERSHQKHDVGENLQSLLDLIKPTVGPPSEREG